MSGINLKNASPEVEEQLREARWRCRTDLIFLCNYVLGYNDVTEELHGPVVDILQKFPLPPIEKRRECDKLVNGVWQYTPAQNIEDLEGKRRMLLLDSRGFLKTTINCIAHSIQWLLNYPDMAIMIVQSNSDKAEMILSEIKAKFQANERFRALFPEYCPQKRINDWGRRDRITVECKRLSNPRGGVHEHKEESIITASIERGMAGVHVDLIKFSDVVDVSNINAEGIKTVISNFALMQNLLVGPLYWIDVEGTRYNHGDLYGNIIETEEKLPPELKEWKIFVRGATVRDWGDQPEQFTMESVMLKPEKLDEKGYPVSRWPKRWPNKKLAAIKADNPWMYNCTPGWTKILMADLSEKSISDIRVGDRVIGFAPNENNRLSLKVTTVKAIGVQPASQVNKVTLTSGETVFCTPDHLWFAGRKNGVLRYREAEVGKTLKQIYPRNANQGDPLTWAYFAGIFDGEGHCSRKNGVISISQSKSANPDVHARMHQVLQDLQFETYCHRRNDKGEHDQWVLLGGRATALKILHNCNPAKSDRLRNLFWNNCGNAIHAELEVEKIEPYSVEDVYFLETETGNYVSQGFASKNCQQQNNPSAGDGTQTFPVNHQFPKWISPQDFVRNVRVSSYEISIDTAETTGKRSDFTSIAVGAWASNGRCYVVEIVHGRFLPSDILNHVVALCNKYRTRLGKVKIEETGFVRGLMPSIRRIMDKNGIYIPIDTIKRDTQEGKNERISNTLQPWYINGDLVFVDDLPVNTKAQLIRELREFPNGKNDDILDSISDLFQNRSWFGRTSARGFAGMQKNLAFDQMLGILSIEDEALIGESAGVFDPNSVTGVY